MKLATILFTQSDLETAMAESPRVRSVVAGMMVAMGNPAQVVNDMKARLRDYVIRTFSNKERIPAIKYVRQWAADNGYSDLKGLAEAKAFIDEILPYPRD